MDEPIRIVASYREGNRSLVVLDRPADHQIAGQRPDASSAGPSLKVALLGSDVQNGRDPPAKFCRDAAPVKCDVADSLGIEGGEKTKNMRAVKHRHFIVEHQVLVHAAASHIKSRGSFPGGGDP